MKKIVVTGANGQLGQCIRKYAESNGYENIVYMAHNEMDITDSESIKKVIDELGEESISAIINCAAYKNCDLAEVNKELAYMVNAIGPRNLATICSERGIKLIHISTDFLSPRNQNTPLKCIPVDSDMCTNVYGSTKSSGECNKRQTQNYCIVRTSWLFSEYGNNFLKTILNRVINEPKTMVVDDQIGSPTNANDLAKFIFEQILTKNISGIINFRNQGVASWYDFAKCIENSYNKITQSDRKTIFPCSEYFNMRQAKRPNYSVLDIRLTETYGEIPYWVDAVYECVNNLCKEV